MKLVRVLLFVSGALWIGVAISVGAGSSGGGLLLFLHISVPIMAYTYAKHLSRPALLYGFVGFLLPPLSALILPFLENLSPEEINYPEISMKISDKSKEPQLRTLEELVLLKQFFSDISPESQQVLIKIFSSVKANFEFSTFVPSDRAQKLADMANQRGFTVWIGTDSPTNAFLYGAGILQTHKELTDTMMWLITITEKGVKGGAVLRRTNWGVFPGLAEVLGPDDARIISFEGGLSA